MFIQWNSCNFRYNIPHCHIDCANCCTSLTMSAWPGGHGERSTAVGTIDMAVWDVVSKIARVPLYEHLAKEYGNGKFPNKIFVYAAGGYYYPGKDIQMLQDEMKSSSFHLEAFECLYLDNNNHQQHKQKSY